MFSVRSEKDLRTGLCSRFDLRGICGPDFVFGKISELVCVLGKIRDLSADRTVFWVKCSNLPTLRATVTWCALRAALAVSIEEKVVRSFKVQN